MVGFMLLCGIFMVRMGGRRGMGGMCGWWRGRGYHDQTDAAVAQRSSDHDALVRPSARGILEERFARGEISEEEFEGRKQVLARNPS
jgi:hypothetical protein